VQLFDREKGRLHLNSHGQFFLRHVNQVMETLEYAKTELRKNQIFQGQHVSLACISTIQWVDMVTAFTLEHPRFTLSCTNYKRSEIANSGLPLQNNLLLSSDDAIPAFMDTEMNNIVLFEDRLAIAVPPEHPLAGKHEVEPEELLEETLLLPMSNNVMYERLVYLFESAGFSAPFGSSYPYLTGLKMAESGLGVAITTAYASQALTMKLRYIPISSRVRPWIYRLYWRKSQPLTADEEVFKTFLQAYYAK
jgi:DNA-binding transcriptional LysR family regulator